MVRPGNGNAVAVLTDAGGGSGPDGPLGGRYVLRDVLGIGSSAVVHRADDVRTGRTVAVKLFLGPGSEVDRRRRRREMEALTRLRHPGLVRLLDGDPTGPRPYVVTELVDGPTLAQAVAAGPMRPDRVERLGAVVAAALAVVHAGGFVHRDVKPANVLLDGAGRPRLADFGIAWVVDGATATTSGAIVGTAAYMSPEQVGGRAVGPATDVYALGLVLIEALTGRREYPGSALESAVARLSRVPRVPADAPAALGAAIAAMTRTDPRARPAAAEVAVLLSGTATGTAVARRPAHRPRARRVVLAAAACVAAPVLALGIGGSSGSPSWPGPAVVAGEPVDRAEEPRAAVVPPPTAGAGATAVVGPSTGLDAVVVVVDEPEGAGTDVEVVDATTSDEVDDDADADGDDTGGDGPSADEGRAGPGDGGARGRSEEVRQDSGGSDGAGRGRGNGLGPPGRAGD